MKYSAEALGRAGDKYLGRSYSEMDCQAFAERCMADVGCRRNLAGSNAWFRAMDWTGTPEECVRLFGSVPAGALLFILARDGKEPAKYRQDGIGNASHMGIKTGRGDGAIHASASRGCVAASVFRDRTVPNGGWNRVGLMKDFDYGEAVNRRLESTEKPEAAGAGKGGEKVKGTVFAGNGKPVNLRKGPGIQYALADRLPVGTQVRITGEAGEWYSVTVKGRDGWIMKPFVRQEGEEEDEKRYTVTVSGLSRAQAEALVSGYPENSGMKEEP